MFKRIIFGAFCWGLLSVWGAAQSPSPEAIVERSLIAMGGQKSLASIRSVTAFADCVSPKGPYKTEIHSARGDRLRFKQLPVQGVSFLAFVNGEHSWTMEEATGQVSAADRKLAAMIRAHEFQLIAASPLARYKNPFFDGYENFDGFRCIKLRATDELGKPAYLFFREDLNLMAGMLLNDPRFDAPTAVRIVFKEWTQVGKVKLPSKVVATDSTGDFILHFKKIGLNQANERIFIVPKKIAAVAELLHLHEQQRVAHVERNAELLVSMFAEDLLSLSDGKINQPSREQSLRRFQSYLGRSTFLEWDDISPPVIRVSEDAGMAYVIVHKRVRILAADESGKKQQETTVFAWMETYEKRNGQWKLTAIASTKTQEEKL
ncbi:MAG TPA: nuclear transport factor 2 family protein [Blastocatellia bacterium]|nr:nuclear transport factor 2 family protein [Blastocatellia bacterium]HMV82528.1 nuclear transport factor 2 family protein [Blastocatellia bacterium]HMX30383.1 nuclear transport factor 2 family protein [Blastocatellia bacterium]HMY76161.1 nuclear transport factor 2 family protein [Blastocatellia bacterium]HMZ18902.1 nuclear transport factor 2 family protein [Blastocatellia bacterium]